MGITSADILSYSPWYNVAEPSMRELSRGITINKYVHESFGMATIYDQLQKLNKSAKYSHYKDYLPIIKWSHRNLKKKSTGFTSNELRLHHPYYTSFLDMNLRLKSLSEINPDDYFRNGIVDYDKFRKLTRRYYKLSHKLAFKNRREYERKQQSYYDTLSTTPFSIGDNVIWKPKLDRGNKLAVNEYYGYYISKILVPGKRYQITHISDKDEVHEVTAGHVRHFHQPLWVHARDMMDGNALRIDNLTDINDEQHHIKNNKDILRCIKEQSLE